MNRSKFMQKVERIIVDLSSNTNINTKTMIYDNKHMLYLKISDNKHMEYYSINFEDEITNFIINCEDTKLNEYYKTDYIRNIFYNESNKKNIKVILFHKGYFQIDFFSRNLGNGFLGFNCLEDWNSIDPRMVANHPNSTHTKRFFGYEKIPRRQDISKEEINILLKTKNNDRNIVMKVVLEYCLTIKVLFNNIYSENNAAVDNLNKIENNIRSLINYYGNTFLHLDYDLDTLLYKAWIESSKANELYFDDKLLEVVNEFYFLKLNIDNLKKGSRKKRKIK